MKFNEIIQNELVLRAVEKIGYENPTDIQAKSIPLIRDGVDIIAKSQTGTGKTMAFAIPVVENIDPTEEKRTVQSLILCPTRELAMQVAEEIKKLTLFTDGVKTAVIFGGSSMNDQIQKLKKANIVVGTPGRIKDHLRRKTLKLQNLRSVILDEADEMLSMGFKEDIEDILKSAPTDVQKVLFSATMPQGIIDITEEFLNEPQTIEIERKKATVSTIKQQYVEVPSGRKQDVLKMLLHIHADELAIIFTNTKKMADEVEQLLNKSGFRALALHGDMKQEQRTKVMSAYKSGEAKILVATDVAARGIDVYDVTLVVNYDIPQNSEYYVHRIGRTGRAGKTGTAITILTGRRSFLDLKDLQRDLNLKIDKMNVPNIDDIKEIRAAKNIETIANFIENEEIEQYGETLEELITKEYTYEQIAKALMGLHFGKSENSLNEIEKIKANYNNDDFVKLKITAGRKHKVSPSHLVSAIASECNIKGATIGKIEIFGDFSIVSVLKNDSDKVISKMNDATVNGHPVSCMLDNKKPFNGGGRKSHSGGDRRGSDRRGDYPKRRTFNK